MQITYPNGTISAEEIIRHLTLTGMAYKIFPEIIKQKEAKKKAIQMNIEASNEQLQKFADNFRYLRGLHSAAATQDFFKKNGWAMEDFDSYCEDAVLANLLKDKLAGEKEIEAFFVNHRSDYDMVNIAEIVVDTENLANEIKMQVEEDGEDFFKLAKKHSAASTRNAGGYIGWVARSRMSAETAAKVMSAENGDLVGPFSEDGQFRLILVDKVRKADIQNTVIRESVKERIYDQWAAQFLKDGVTVGE